MILVPRHFRYKKTGPVSCYAIFKEWLLPSLPADYLIILVSLALNHFSGP